MRDMGLQGVIRGKPVKTTNQQQGCAMLAGSRQPPVQGAKAECPVALRLHLCRDLDRLCLRRLCDRRLCPQDRGLASLAHGARRLRARCAGALHDRRPVHRGGLVHHSDRGSQYLSIKYNERLAEAGVEPSVGSVGDSYDNALAETINGLYKAQVIHRRGPWRSFEAVESRPWNGWTGSTTDGSWSPSAIYRRPESSNAIAPYWNNRPWPA
jgi:putative transposase